MEIGLKKEMLFTVLSENSAKNMGSGDLLVLATPSLIAYFENVSKELLRPYLEEGNTTVGININVDHLAPTKIGNEVKVIAEITEINKRIITLNLEAYEGDNLIGKGTHKRCIVNVDKFMSKLN